MKEYLWDKTMEFYTEDKLSKEQLDTIIDYTLSNYDNKEYNISDYVITFESKVLTKIRFQDNRTEREGGEINEKIK